MDRIDDMFTLSGSDDSVMRPASHSANDEACKRLALQQQVGALDVVGDFGRYGDGSMATPVTMRRPTLLDGRHASTTAVLHDGCSGG